jgi:hypothetical protein
MPPSGAAVYSNYFLPRPAGGINLLPPQKHVSLNPVRQICKCRPGETVGRIILAPACSTCDRHNMASAYCALWTVSKVISGLRKPIAIQAAISFNINFAE